ncbi:isoaspartyl peptidase/L-asparaginase [Halorussus gelatinilyticus]|uniref:Plant-type L-asparaginase n=1 Tax=Halorussus gelatinilyticus TaxID=2937524 RepID=A0A8U0ILN1_9EURY|nr:isoaspartyl peptidase/L-asparaginase [Halorussus gelatinilyticus]UPW01252.1 isoaspartyl peptidase/L-asparaginase [Halorussus gelatinilyticus]
MKVIVHGGAGSAPDEPEPRQEVLDEAAQTGAAESSVVDAVEAAVHVLESAPRFNAGVGGAVQSDGAIRTDAGLMTGDREAGAACSMPGVEHAVSAARVVMEETPHVLVSGDRAVELAADFGVETGADLWSEDTRERWADLDSKPTGTPREHLDWLTEKFGGSPESASEESDENPKDHDTVGAVAYDSETDEFAAATSTGGRWLALAGRVGDVPQIGSGFFAAPAGAASATGAGEDIAKATLTRRAVRHLESGYEAQAAADRAIEEFAELTGSSAGVILLDGDGNAGSAFNSEAMQTAVSSRSATE